MSVWLRFAGIGLVVAALCGAAAGCVSDTGAALSGASQGPGESSMRYYGGPKYPMWSNQ